jgi:hypothetical protein
MLQYYDTSTLKMQASGSSKRLLHIYNYIVTSQKAYFMRGWRYQETHKNPYDWMIVFLSSKSKIFPEVKRG